LSDILFLAQISDAVVHIDVESKQVQKLGLRHISDIMLTMHVLVAFRVAASCRRGGDFIVFIDLTHLLCYSVVNSM